MDAEDKLSYAQNVTIISRQKWQGSTFLVNRLEEFA